jgi:hypothetical protein
MGSQRRIALKPVALLLVFAVLQVYVLITPAKASAATNTTSTNSASETSVRFGQLLMSESQSALVNGTSATTGTTIFSGTQLQTPEGAAATVNLGTLGKISIDPNTLLTLTFDKDYVDVQVKTGNAVLTTNAGVTGTLTTAEGQKLATNATANSTVGSKAARRSWDGDHVLGFVITAVVLGFALIALTIDDDNESPARP